VTLPKLVRRGPRVPSELRDFSAAGEAKQAPSFGRDPFRSVADGSLEE